MKGMLKRFKHCVSKIGVRKIYSATIFLLMFLYGFNFLGYSSIFLVLLIAIFSIKIIVCREIVVNPMLVLITLFGFSYFAFEVINFGFKFDIVIKFLIAPPVMYEMGISILRTYKNKQKAFLDTIFAFSLGFAVFVISCFVASTLQFGLFPIARVSVNIWNGGFFSATGAGLLISLIGAFAFPVIFLKSPDKKWYHVICVVFCTIMTIWISLAFSNRTQLIVFVAGLLIGAVSLTMINPKYRKPLIISVVGLIIGGVGIVVMYQTQLFGFDEFILKIPLMRRIFLDSGLLESGRFNIYIAFFKQFIYYPFGGKKIVLPDYELYCHNVWLDAYYTVGVVPFIFLFIITLWAIQRVTVINILEKNAFLNTLIMCFFYSMLLFFMVEPVVEASIYLFLTFFTFIGMVDYFYHQRISAHVMKSARIPADGHISVVFISNYLSQHQHAFCRELLKTYGNRFKFIATVPFNNVRIGLETCGHEFDTCTIEMFKDKENANNAINNADVIIAGNAPNSIVRSQLKKGKIVFKYSERIYKTANLFAYLSPKAIYRQFVSYHWFLKYRFYFLCASAYASYDISRFAISEKRCFKWGYFIGQSPFESFEELFEQKNHDELTEILFVNRLIKLKHPEKCITVARYLKRKKIPFKMKIIGIGEMEQKLKDDIKKYNLSENVVMLGVVDNEEVLNLMRRANIVFASSDFCEGWGVCVNEAMTAGCAVVASHSHGSVPYLIKNQINGIIYEFDDESDMLFQIEKLCLDRSKTEELGKNAFNTMKTTWGAEEATAKLVKTINSMVNNLPIESNIQDGPMSPAEIHDHEWFKRQNKKQQITQEKEELSETVKSNNRIRNGAIISYIAVLLNFVAAILYTPWMIRTIGEENYSIYTLAMSIIGLFVVDLGLSSALSRYLAKYRVENDVKKANQFLGLLYKIFIAIDVFILIILAIVFVFIKQIYGNTYQTTEALYKFKVVFAVVGFYTIISFAAKPLTSILSANEKFAFQKTVELIHRLLVVGMVVAALLLGGDLYAVVFANVISGLISIVLNYIYIKRKIDLKPDFSYKDKPLLKEVFRYSIWVMIASLGMRLIMGITPTIISITTGDQAQVNLWAIAVIIEGYMYTLSAAANGLFLPKFTVMENKKASIETYTKSLINIGRIKLLIVALLVIGFISIGKGFIGVWIGEEYAGSYIVAVIIISPSLLLTPMETAITLVAVQNKVKYRAISAVITGLICVSLSFILSSSFGVIGSAIGICIGIFIGEVIIQNYLFQKHLGINMKKVFLSIFSKFGLQIIACIIFGLALERVLPTTGKGILVVKGIILVAFYSAVMWFLGMNKKEKEIIGKLCEPVFKQIRKINQE